jgi:hypothetical protein
MTVNLPPYIGEKMLTCLTDEQKQALFDDGVVVIRNAIPDELSQRARDLLERSLPGDEHKLLVPPQLATHEDILSLFNDTCLARILRKEMGPFPEVISSQVAVLPPHQNELPPPFPHVDGSWSGEIPSRAEEIDVEKGRPLDAPKYFGENDDRRGTNDGQLWLDPDRRISLGSYSALVGVCLNEQLSPGNGQFSVLKGMHHDVKAAFKMQRRAGGVIGSEGPDWPRIRIDENGRPQLNGLPNSVRGKAMRAVEGRKPDDEWPWPWLTPVLMDQGDAFIALHSCPHSPTPNLGNNPRMNVLFRIRRLRENNPHEGSRRLGHGVSDHLDRGYYGQFLEYPPEYDPWKTSVDKLCDIWSEWDGMKSIVARNRQVQPEVS